LGGEQRGVTWKEISIRVVALAPPGAISLRKE